MTTVDGKELGGKHRESSRPTLMSDKAEIYEESALQEVSSFSMSEF